jgi:hypothetical protein
MIAAHEPLRDKSDENPRRIIDSGGNWHEPDAGEKNGHIDISPK